MADVTTIEGVYPLTPMQEGMWFHSRLTPGHDVYVEQLSVLIEGSLDATAFRLAWHAAIARHTALRSSFHAVQGKPPVQLTHRQVEAPWLEEDWRDVTEREQHDRLAVFTEKDRARAFDLSRPPLMRFALLRLGDSAHQFVWTHHHLLLDGWSVPLVLRDVLTSYAAAREERAVTLPRPRSYREYLDWLQRQDPATAERFWRAELRGFGEPTPLPFDHDHVSGATVPDYDELRIELSPGVTADLQAVMRRRGLTPGTVLQGAWALLLSRYSGEADVVHGMTVAGRPPGLTGVEDIVGLFINTVPVRVLVEPSRPAGDWLCALQDRLVRLRDHEHAPLAQLQRWADVRTGAPLFESLVVYENYPLDPNGTNLEDLGLTFHRNTGRERTSYPLTLVGMPGRRLGLQLIFDTARTSPRNAATLLEQLSYLLTALAAAPDTPVGALPLVPPQAALRQARQWNDATRAAYPRDDGLAGQFTAQAAAGPDAVAVVEGSRHCTYSHLAALAGGIAAELRARHLPPMGRVGILLPRSVAFVAAIVGILQADGAYVPLDAGYPAARLSFMIDDCGLDAVVTDAAHGGNVPARAGLPVLYVDEPADAPVALPDSPSSCAGGDAPAYVMYTSGSTGAPKGIVIPQRAVTRLVRNTDYVRLSAVDRLCHASDTAFDAATFEVWGALLNGAALVIVGNDDVVSPAAYARVIREQAVTTAFLTTALYQQIAAADPTALASLRTLMFGGEQLDPALTSDVLDRGAPGRLLHVYGPTESTTFALWHQVRHVPDGARTVPIGRPLANTTAYVLDPAGSPVPPGTVGELYLGGDGLAHGYAGRPALTAERFLPDALGPVHGGRLYRTGDLVRTAEGGTLTFLGRTDAQVKLRVFRIEPGETEHVLRGHPAVRAAAVQVRADLPGGDRRLVGYVVTDGAPVTPAELRAHCARQLPGFMVPAVIAILGSLPLTPNGKVDYGALPVPSNPAPGAGAADRAPRNSIERLVAGVWEEVLSVEHVGIDDDFFALGGHSLLAARVHNRVNAVFGVEVPLRLLFTRPTVAALAAEIETARSARGGALAEPLPPLRPSQDAGDAPLSFAQQRLWFLEIWEPGTALYHITGAVRLHGPLGVSELRTAWRRLVSRHDALRAHIDDSVPPEPRQVVRPPWEVELPLVDLSALFAGARDETAGRLVRAVTETPLELKTGPLWRLALLRTGPSEHVLAIALHHLIADGRALEVLLPELGQGYRAARADEDPRLPALPVRFADYARWQRSWLGGVRLASQLAYWKRQLAGLEGASLPTDRPRRADGSAEAAVESVELPTEAGARLRALCRETGVTPFMAFLAVFAVTLGHNRHLTEVAIGTPVAGRNRTELENVIGFFANTLVLRIGLDADPTFRTLLQRVREVCLDAYAHQDVPFEQVVQEVSPERDEVHLPLFQTWFVVQEALPVDDAFAGLRAEPVPGAEQQARYDLRLDVQRRGDALRAVFEYKPELFDGVSISRLALRFGRLLEGAATQPDAPLSAPARQVAAADDRAREERQGAVSLASLQRLKGARRELTREFDGSGPTQGGDA